MPLIVEEVAPRVTLLTIDNQSKRNAMSREMLRELGEQWVSLDQSECRCVVITGAGEQAFCAGADISGDLSAGPEVAQMVSDALLKTRVFTKPIIAAVNGVCAGGGVELLLASDIRFAAPQARFGLPEVKWAIYPFGGAAVKLVQQIGYVHAMDLLLTARLVDAAYAERINLINQVVPAESLLSQAIATASAIAANSPVAVQAVREQISATLVEHALTREPLEQALGDRVRASADFTEGVDAFRGKRVPDYG